MSPWGRPCHAPRLPSARWLLACKVLLDCSPHSAQGELGSRVQVHDAIRLLLAAHHHALDTAVVVDVLAGHINLRADVESHQEDAAAQVHVESEGNGGG